MYKWLMVTDSYKLAFIKMLITLAYNKTKLAKLRYQNIWLFVCMITLTYNDPFYMFNHSFDKNVTLAHLYT